MTSPEKPSNAGRREDDHGGFSGPGEHWRRRALAKVRLRFAAQSWHGSAWKRLGIPFATEKVDLLRLFARTTRLRTPPIANVHCNIVDVERFDSWTVKELTRAKLPFAVVLGGAGDLSLGAAMVRSGAFWIVDRSGADHQAQVMGWILRVSALGLLSKWPLLSQQSPLGPLALRPIHSLSDWMDLCDLSRRRLEQLCVQWTGMPPAKSLRRFHALRFLLAYATEPVAAKAFFGTDDFEWCRSSFTRAAGDRRPRKGLFED